MNIELNSKIKFKLMSKEDLIISLDRLTRFKNPEIKYRRVFFEIVLKHLIFPSISKNKLSDMPVSFIVNSVEEIWNESVKMIWNKNNFNFYSLIQYDCMQYSIDDEDTLSMMNAKLDILTILENLEIDNIPLNLYFLKQLSEFYSSKNSINLVGDDIRKKYKTLFPIKKLILTEGITEEILLPEFARKYGYDFSKEGIFVLATGGKSKVLSLYAELKYILKIPIFVLLDNDAEPIYRDVISVLRKKDNAYLIQHGEFEDILSLELIKKAFSYMNYDVKPADDSEIISEFGTCNALENLWKSRGLGEFRKAHFAKAVKDCLSNEKYITKEINEILNKIIDL